MTATIIKFLFKGYLSGFLLSVGLGALILFFQGPIFDLNATLYVWLIGPAMLSSHFSSQYSVVIFVMIWIAYYTILIAKSKEYLVGRKYGKFVLIFLFWVLSNSLFAYAGMRGLEGLAR